MNKQLASKFWKILLYFSFLYFIFNWVGFELIQNRLIINFVKHLITESEMIQLGEGSIILAIENSYGVPTLCEDASFFPQRMQHGLPNFLCQQVLNVDGELVGVTPIEKLHSAVKYLEMGDTAIASEILSQVPDANTYLLNRGFLQFRLGNYDQAMLLLDLSERMESVSDQNKWMLLQARCVIYREQNRLDEAIKNCLQLSVIMQDWGSYMLLGRSYFDAGRYQMAEDNFWKAEELERNAPTLTWLARSRSGQGMTLDAIELLHDAIELAPEYIWAHIYLADKYAEVGEQDLAQMEYLAALDISPSLEIYISKKISSLMDSSQ